MRLVFSILVIIVAVLALLLVAYKLLEFSGFLPAFLGGN